VKNRSRHRFFIDGRIGRRPCPQLAAWIESAGTLKRRTAPNPPTKSISEHAEAVQGLLQILIAPYVHKGLAPGPISMAGFAPFLGIYFCARPLSTSATYKLPS